MEFNYQRNASTTNYVMLSYELKEHEWKSLYLKSWPEDVIVDGRMINDTEDLKWLIEEVLCIGKVERIDSGSRKNRSGKEQSMRSFTSICGMSVTESLSGIASSIKEAILLITLRERKNHFVPAMVRLCSFASTRT